MKNILFQGFIPWDFVPLGMRLLYIWTLNRLSIGADNKLIVGFWTYYQWVLTMGEWLDFRININKYLWCKKRIPFFLFSKNWSVLAKSNLRFHHFGIFHNFTFQFMSGHYSLCGIPIGVDQIWLGLCDLYSVTQIKKYVCNGSLIEL